MKVYIVKHDTAQSTGDMDFYIFESFEKAFKKFKTLIQETMTSKDSWVSTVKWTNGLPPTNYRFSCKINGCPNEEQYWSLKDDYEYDDYYQYTGIFLYEQEVL